MWEYDRWLDACTEEYMRECEPELMGSMKQEYNCEYCDNDECPHWEDYHSVDTPDEEYDERVAQAEREAYNNESIIWNIA